MNKVGWIGVIHQGPPAVPPTAGSPCIAGAALRGLYPQIASGRNQPMEQTVRITALEPRRRSPDIIEVRLEGAPRLVLPAEVVLAAGLRVGDEIDAAQLATLQEEFSLHELAIEAIRISPQSARMPRSFTTAPHFCISALMWAASSSGVLITRSSP